MSEEALNNLLINLNQQLENLTTKIEGIEKSNQQTFDIEDRLARVEKAILSLTIALSNQNTKVSFRDKLNNFVIYNKGLLKKGFTLIKTAATKKLDSTIEKLESKKFDSKKMEKINSLEKQKNEIDNQILKSAAAVNFSPLLFGSTENDKIVAENINRLSEESIKLEQKIEKLKRDPLALKILKKIKGIDLSKKANYVSSKTALIKSTVVTKIKVINTQCKHSFHLLNNKAEENIKHHLSPDVSAQYSLNHDKKTNDQINLLDKEIEHLENKHPHLINSSSNSFDSYNQKIYDELKGERKVRSDELNKPIVQSTVEKTGKTR